MGLMLWVRVGLGSEVLCNLACVSPFPQSFKLTIGQILEDYLTAVLVETGAMPVLTKSQNPTVCG